MVRFGRAARTRPERQINTQYGALDDPPYIPASLLLFEEKICNKSLLKKIRESVTASFIVLLFNNATAGDSVNLNVSLVRLK
jgi:hypothetical protein